MIFATYIYVCYSFLLVNKLFLSLFQTIQHCHETIDSTLNDKNRSLTIKQYLIPTVSCQNYHPKLYKAFPLHHIDVLNVKVKITCI
uniref:Uncharacterized protein n=1 Tax=Pararge aegeria TaxID=116150 RepID=S4NVT6_9NEOP